MCAQNTYFLWILMLFGELRGISGELRGQYGELRGGCGGVRGTPGGVRGGAGKCGELRGHSGGTPGGGGDPGRPQDPPGGGLQEGDRRQWKNISHACRPLKGSADISYLATLGSLG